MLNCTRVDVSETFSANQLWFRILSGLFQRCSLPENLWAELIQSWTALISSEAALNSVDFWIIQNGNFWFIFHFFSSFNFFEVPQFRGIWLWLSTQFAKRSEQQKNSCSYRPKMSHKLDFFGFIVTAQVTKQIWFNFSKPFLRLEGWLFKIIPRNLSFWCEFAEFRGNLPFL